MQPGRYRHRIVIEKLETEDSPHGTIEEWNEHITIWGRVTEVNLDGREKYDQIGYSDVSKQVEFSYPVDVKMAGYRIVYNNQTYELIEPLSSDQIGRLSSVVVRRKPQDGDDDGS